MSFNPTVSNQGCPQCGASNSPHSVFCAECGTSLESSNQSDEHEAEGQTTVSFTPVDAQDDPENASWRPVSDTQSTQEFTPQASLQNEEASYDVSTWQAPKPYMARPAQSRRGFILGLVAALLITVVIGFFFWSSIVSDGFRDSITGLF